MAAAGDAVAKLLYIAVVEDDDGDLAAKETTSFRYTRSVLQSTLQFMGCKPRHAFKISQGVFEKMKYEFMAEKVDPEVSEVSKNDTMSVSQKLNEANLHARVDEAGVDRVTIDDDMSRRQPFELYKRRTTVFVGRKHFLDVVCESLSAYKYIGPNQRADLLLACRIRERKESLTVLLCGTSGCGKSTLSALLGGRLGITTVISTDSIRHMMRSFVDEEHNPLLWASTYHAGEHLDPVAVAEAKAKRKAKKTGGVSAAAQPKDPGASSTSLTEKSGGDKFTNNMISTKQMAIEGFKAQSEMIIESLDRLITSWEERKESAVVEGVHLSLNFVMGLMKKHPSIIPFMVYISNEEKHLERFAVRAKYMTLDPARNKYVKYIRNIRKIQEYLCNRADKHLVPKINNTNVDRSVAAIHATVFSCLRRRAAGEHLYDPITNTVPLVNEEYKNQCAANSLSSKGMFQLIQRQGSSRRLMALLNNDGSVAKAWPVDVVDDKGKPLVGPLTENELGNPVYGPLKIGRSETVNLQFGHFGISAWQSDTGGTSHASSVDESRGELTDNGSRYYSSCCSTPKFSDGPFKEHMEEESVHGSDEEDIDEPLEVDSDEDVSDGQESRGEEELEGSVDEGSTKSDEEYDDLAMQDDNQGSGYLSDNEDEFKAKTSSQHDFTSANDGIHKNDLQRNFDLLPKLKSEPLSESLMRAFGSPKDKNEKKLPSFANRRLKKRSQSIPASKGRESLIKALTSNEAPPS